MLNLLRFLICQQLIASQKAKFPFLMGEGALSIGHNDVFNKPLIGLNPWDFHLELLVWKIHEVFIH